MSRPRSQKDAVTAELEARERVRIGALQNAGTRAKIEKSEARRTELVRLVFEEGYGIQAACKMVPVSYNTYSKWRQRYPDFAARIDAKRIEAKANETYGVPLIDYSTDFAAFRQRFLKMDSTWFQLRAINALEQCKPGEIILLLWPPEHGKTTTVEDFCNWKVAHNPDIRISVVSEKQSHAKKVLRRVRNRMEPEGPTPDYVIRYGPFHPASGEGHREMPQPWTDAFFDVRQRQGSFDERDYTMSAVGIKTGIQGTRADWMLIDDIQGLKSLNLSDDYVELLRQDFFSRPGMKGRICILGTRVGRDDVYEKLMEAGLIDHLIVFPAQSADGEWLWPENYSPEEYAKMRHRVGEQAWSRNYMQQPTSAKEQTFTEEQAAECLNPQRSVIATCPVADGNTTPVVVALDPSLGGANCTGAFGLLPNRFAYLSSRVDEGFTRTDQLFDVLEETIIRWNEPGISVVTTVVIEAMAFQRGLLTDTRMKEIARRYKVSVVPHMTGVNKYDPNIGIPSMALSWARGEWDFPYADEPSRREVDALLREAYHWRPYKRGNRLVQDRVMMAWFAWLRWRNNRSNQVVDLDAFRREGSPLQRRHA